LPVGPDLAVWEGIVRLLVAAALAGAIGLERELREQEAGLRTHMLVGLGACLFVLGGTYGWDELEFGNQVGIVMDPTRVAAYVVTGIGFLGAGAIIKHGVNVRGLTTAASLWVVAAIGTTTAAGGYAWAVATTAIVLLSLWPLRRIAGLTGVRSRGAQRLEVVLSAAAKVVDVVDALETFGAEVEDVHISEEAEHRRVEFVLHGRRSELVGAVEAVARVAGVESAAWSP
jgi:putative Mg2+ transporter-C (MgtC) family protein